MNMWSFVSKKRVRKKGGVLRMQDALKTQKQCLTQELKAGDCWIGLSLPVPVV